MRHRSRIPPTDLTTDEIPAITDYSTLKEMGISSFELISRFSLRGIVATVFYILAGGITVVLFRHLLGVI